jgi:hypothetical protein
MRAALRAVVRIVPVFVSLWLATSVSAQTLFTTKDYRQDRERCTDPAYINF